MYFENDIKLKSIQIWHLISKKGRISFKEIEALTGFSNLLISLALGWLTREDKITFVSENDTVYAKPANCPTDIYY